MTSPSNAGDRAPLPDLRTKSLTQQLTTALIDYHLGIDGDDIADSFGADTAIKRGRSYTEEPSAPDDQRERQWLEPRAS